MTTTVYIQAHCGEGKQVEIEVDGEALYIEDGETHEVDVYDDKVVAIKEVAKV